MSQVVEALIGAARSMVHPIILLVMLVPMSIALAVWIAAGWWYWDVWTSAIGTAFTRVFPQTWIPWELPHAAAWIGGAIVVALLIPLIILTALLIAAFTAMPLLVGHVAKAEFPALARQHGGTLIGSVWNVLGTFVVFALLWLLTLPLWLLGPLAAVLPLALSAYLNQRLFRYDALSEHASAQEMKQIFDLARGRLVLLGLITGMLYFIPPFNLIAPVYAALAFIHLCLGELRRLRSVHGDSMQTTGM